MTDLTAREQIPWDQWARERRVLVLPTEQLPDRERCPTLHCTRTYGHDGPHDYGRGYSQHRDGTWRQYEVRR